MIAPMNRVRHFLRALPAPIYALIMSDTYRPENYHVGVWFLIFVVLELLSLISDWTAWHWPGWAQLANVALFATLLCRLALVEYELNRLKGGVPEDDAAPSEKEVKRAQRLKESRLQHRFNEAITQARERLKEKAKSDPAKPGTQK